MLLVVGCASSTGPTEPPEPWQVREFVLAQENLFAFFGDNAIWNVSIERFRLIEVHTEGSFRCGGKDAVGCYMPGGREIRWASWAPTVLRHEFGHGIADVLHLKKNGCDWHGWEHDPGCP